MQKSSHSKEENKLAAIEETLAETGLLLQELNTVVSENLKKITKNINKIISELETEVAKAKSDGFEPSILLDFEDHLRLTVRVLLELGIATANEVSKKTRRSRSLESSYLNQLTRMGYVEKEKRGRMAYYRIRFDKKA
jgi:uncharacterized membrane protein